MIGRPAPQPAPSPSLFDGQAASYERRAEVPAEVCRRVVDAALALSGAGAGDLVVEVGAGTGTIGRWFVGRPPRYLGFDLAPGMLAGFRRKLAEGRRGARAGVRLLCADGNRVWPLAAGTARLVFGSRALHLLASDHVAREVARVTRPAGATLLTGRLRFAPGGMRDRMAEEMRRRLRRAGFEPRGGRRVQDRLMATVAALGGEPIAGRTLGEWPALSTPRRSIEDWRGKPGLGGIDPPGAVKREVLDGLEAWAEREFGDLDRGERTPVAYVLEGVRLRPGGG